MRKTSNCETNIHFSIFKNNLYNSKTLRRKNFLLDSKMSSVKPQANIFWGKKKRIIPFLSSRKIYTRISKDYKDREEIEF